jgi:hypothetical protein
LICLNAGANGPGQDAPMPRSFALIRARPLEALPVLLLGGAVVLFAVAMAPPLMARLLFGPICSGHGSALARHCPACYAAVVLLAAAGIAAYITRERGSATSP